MGIDLAAMTWVLLWLNLFGFVRQLDQRLATFVMMFERIVRDMWVFLLFYMMWVFMPRRLTCELGRVYAESGFHDDGPRPASTATSRDPEISTHRRRSPCAYIAIFFADAQLHGRLRADNYPRTWTGPARHG